MAINMIPNFITSAIESSRPKQATKNLFVLSALLFSKNIFAYPQLLKALFAFVIFCVISGAVYIFNDIMDIEEDKQHPVKSKRPIASGRFRISHAIITLVLLLIIGIAASFCLNIYYFLTVVIYIAIQLAYSYQLKKEVILDVFAIAAGFLIRMIAGAVAIQVEISSWFLICGFLLALFLGLGKRRHEFLLLQTDTRLHRQVLRKYSLYLLDQMIAVVTAAIVVSYCLYTISEETIRKFGTKNLMFTIPFVLYGLFRYLYLIHHKNCGGQPEIVVFADKPLILSIIGWGLISGLIIYW